MSKITLEGNASGTGTFTIAAPNSNTSYTLTLPQTSGTILTSGGSQTIEFVAGSASTPSITFTGDTNTGIFSPAADTIAFTEGGAESMRISSSGVVSIGTTDVGGTLNTTTTSGNWGQIIYDNANNASMLQFRNNAGAAAGNISLSSAGATSLLISSVAGVNFPATQVASADANTLDDYEEGDWTPTVGAEISNPTGVSYSTRSGSYTKIGNVVYIRVRVNFSFTGGTGSGALEISGLPFTSRAGISQPRSSPQQDNISYTGFTYLDMGTNANTTKIGIAKNRSGSGASGVLIGDCASGGTDINGGFFYFV